MADKPKQTHMIDGPQDEAAALRTQVENLTDTVQELMKEVRDLRTGNPTRPDGTSKPVWRGLEPKGAKTVRLRCNEPCEYDGVRFNPGQEFDADAEAARILTQPFDAPYPFSGFRDTNSPDAALATKRRCEVVKAA